MRACRLDNRCRIFLAWGALFAATFLFLLPDARSTGNVARIGLVTMGVSEQSEEAKAFQEGLRDGELVYESDRARRVNFEVAARREYLDLLPILRRYRKAA